MFQFNDQTDPDYLSMSVKEETLKEALNLKFKQQIESAGGDSNFTSKEIPDLDELGKEHLISKLHTPSGPVTFGRLFSVQ